MKTKKITISIPQTDWNRVVSSLVKEFEPEGYKIPNPEKTIKGLIVDIFGNDMAESLWDGVLDNYGDDELEGLGITGAE